jgi:hypothetical protein
LLAALSAARWTSTARATMALGEGLIAARLWARICTITDVTVQPTRGT